MSSNSSVWLLPTQAVWLNAGLLFDLTLERFYWLICACMRLCVCAKESFSWALWREGLSFYRYLCAIYSWWIDCFTLLKRSGWRCQSCGSRRCALFGADSPTGKTLRSGSTAGHDEPPAAGPSRTRSNDWSWSWTVETSQHQLWDDDKSEAGQRGQSGRQRHTARHGRPCWQSSVAYGTNRADGLRIVKQPVGHSRSARYSSSQSPLLYSHRTGQFCKLHAGRPSPMLSRSRCRWDILIPFFLI